MLTRKQHELLTFIQIRLEESGISPSFEEMKEALDLKSKSGVHRLISALEERGFIRRLPNRARALEAKGDHARAVQVLTDFHNRLCEQRVLDPACGTGGFLTCTIAHKRKHCVKTPDDERTLQASIFGVEKKPLPHLLAHRAARPARRAHSTLALSWARTAA